METVAPGLLPGQEEMFPLGGAVPGTLKVRQPAGSVATGSRTQLPGRPDCISSSNVLSVVTLYWLHVSDVVLNDHAKHGPWR